MNIILTGVSGTLGSQLLLELLKDTAIESIFLFIRDKSNITAKDRFERILNSASYKNLNTKAIIERIEVLNEKTFFTPEAYLSKSTKNYFIHSAGFVNLSTDASQKEDIFEKNHEFTKHVFDKFNAFITKFTYISTAFSIGSIGGILPNNYHNGIKPNYRNAYEASKHLTEKYLLQKEQSTGVIIQILRPSVIGGTTQNNPNNYISKFMVYYLIGKFFYKNPLASNNAMRLSINFKTGLNIIPVDYVSKVIKKVLFKDIQQLNIVHKKCTNLVSGLTTILNTVGFKDFSFLDSIAIKNIDSKNSLESFYYNSIGEHLSAYNLCEPYEFDTSELESILPMPVYDQQQYLKDTIKYAMDHNFRNEKW